MMKRIDETAGRNPFRVPENYFEDVNRRIIAETAEKASEPVKPRLYARIRPYLAMAAAVAMLAVLSYATVKILLPLKDQQSIPEISMQEFSDSYLNDIDILMLEERVEPLLFSEEVPEVSKNEIIDYLMLENIDINEIQELL
jgi:hypothetical protein